MAFSRVFWGLVLRTSGDFLFLALLKGLLGIIFFCLLKQILAKPRVFYQYPRPYRWFLEAFTQKPQAKPPVGGSRYRFLRYFSGRSRVVLSFISKDFYGLLEFSYGFLWVVWFSLGFLRVSYLPEDVYISFFFEPLVSPLKQNKTQYAITTIQF